LLKALKLSAALLERIARTAHGKRVATQDGNI
jgi:hypothetical protein